MHISRKCLLFAVLFELIPWTRTCLLVVWEFRLFRFCCWLPLFALVGSSSVLYLLDLSEDDGEASEFCEDVWLAQAFLSLVTRCPTSSRPWPLCQYSTSRDLGFGFAIYHGLVLASSRTSLHLSFHVCKIRIIVSISQSRTIKWYFLWSA